MHQFVLPNSRHRPSFFLRVIERVLIALLAVFASGSVAIAGEPVVIQTSMAGVQHHAVLGSPGNTVLTLTVPDGAVVTGIGWMGTLTTVGDSWPADADIAFGNLGDEPHVIVTPGEGDEAPTPKGGTFYTSHGIISLGSLGLPGFPVSSGTVAIEFADSFENNPDAPPVWSAPANVFVQYIISDSGECPADLNNDTMVNVSDLLLMLSAWGQCGAPSCPADLNGDGFVNVSDMLILLGAWGACPPSTGTGACCFEDGSCQDLTQVGCGSEGGSFQGLFTNCETWLCPQPPDGSTCDRALLIEVDGRPILGDTTGNEPPEIMPDCGNAGTPPTSGMLWFLVEGDGTALTASTCGSPLIETRVAVYCGNSCMEEQIECIAGSNDGCKSSFQSQVSWCSEPGQFYHIGVWGTANSPGEIELTVNSGQPCSDAHPCPWPCDGFCGGLTPDGCWCDDTCGGAGDCCPSVCTSCPGLPQCSECGSIECPPGSTPEPEPCGADVNGGCNSNSSNPPMTTLACGQTYCGTLWAQDGARDTDWYQMNLTGHSGAVEVTFTVEADVVVDVFLLGEITNCNPIILEEASGCSTTFTVCLPPDQYSVVVVPQSLFGLPCSEGPFRYTLEAVCGQSCADPDSCAGNCGGFAPSGCACDDECVIFGDCCEDACQECPSTC